MRNGRSGYHLKRCSTYIRGGCLAACGCRAAQLARHICGLVPTMVHRGPDEAQVAHQAAGLGLLPRRLVMAAHLAATFQHLAPPTSTSFGGQRLGSGEAGAAAATDSAGPGLTPPASTFPWRAGGRRGWLPPSSAAQSPPRGSPSCTQTGRQERGGGAVTFTAAYSSGNSSVQQRQQKQPGQLFQQSQRVHPASAHACT